MNFLLEPEDVEQALRSMADALTGDGLLYFDVVTERMVTKHFAGRDWEEDNDGFQTRWQSTYDKKKAVSETSVRVSTGAASVIRERMYPIAFFEEAVRKAGLNLLAVYDAETWNPPTKRTTRVDFIAKRAITADDRHRFREVREHVRRCLY